MDFFHVIQNRSSMRAFQDKPVDPGLIQKVFQSMNCAPSAGNLQAFEVYLVTNPEHKTELARAAWDQESLAQAPVVLVFCTHPALNAGQYGARGRDLYALQDATIACAYAQLAVAALGLASVWVGAFDEKKVHPIIGSPEGQRPVAMLPIGYAAKPAESRPRRELSSLVHEI